MDAPTLTIARTAATPHPAPAATPNPTTLTALTVTCWALATWLVVALATGSAGAADLGRDRGSGWLAVSAPAVIVGALLVRAAKQNLAQPAPWAARTGRLVAITWGVFRLVGSTVSATFVARMATNAGAGATWIDVALLGVLAISGGGLLEAGVRYHERGHRHVIAWAGAGLIVAGLIGAATAAAGSAIAAALLLHTHKPATDETGAGPATGQR